MLVRALEVKLFRNTFEPILFHFSCVDSLTANCGECGRLVDTPTGYVLFNMKIVQKYAIMKTARTNWTMGDKILS